MKLFAYLQLILTLILMPLLMSYDSSSAAENPNLIDNPSTEIIEGNAPRSWTANSWGTNTAVFSHVDSANTGTKSLKTEVTAFTDGDAKWYPDAVDVTSSENYIFSEYYRSSVSTEVVVQFTNTDGSFSYQWLQTAAESADWSRIAKSLSIPANATKLSVFHIVNSVGWLEIDDYSLTLELPYVEQPSENLILNSSFESASAVNTDMPIKWLSSSWGTNSAAFKYSEDAHTGSKSVQTTVGVYTSGDAKWYFDPIQVTPGETYIYSHYYKSNTPTEAVVRYELQDGSYKYDLFNSVKTSTDWVKYSTLLTPPANAVNLTLFHNIASVGQLTIDDAELVVYDQDASNPIRNSSVEIASNNSPIGWRSNNWGDNGTIFSYRNEGHTGDRSIRVDVSRYVNGDAKWYFDPVSLIPGQEYEFNVWYKAGVIPNVYAMFQLQDGTTAFQVLPTPQPNRTEMYTVWQEYKNTFSMPINAVSASVFMMINQVGWVQTDDYSITPYLLEGFNRPLVSLTFDDGHETNTSTALPIMQSHGFLSTQCYATTFIEDADDEQQAIDGVLQFKDAGHEICSHTVTHPFLTQLSTANATYELSYSQQYLQSITGEPILNFASPYGDYNSSVINIIDNYYQSHRTVDEGYNARSNFDIYRIKVQNMQSTTTIEEFQGWLDQAAATNTWLVLVYHRVADDPGTYETYTTDFVTQMQALANSGLTVKTYNEALLEVVPQL